MEDFEVEQGEYLLNEVVNEIDDLKRVKLGSEDHSRATSDAVKLHDQLLKEWKFAADMEKETKTLEQTQERIDLDRERLKFEQEQESKSTKRQKIEFVAKLVMDGIAILVPACIYNTWMKRGFEFEKEGTYTSTTFRNLTSKFKPTKR